MGESLSEWKITERLAGKLGHPYKYTDIAEIFLDITKHVKEMEDLTWDEIGPFGDRVQQAGKSDKPEHPESFDLAATGCFIEKVWERKYF